jgi:serine/threonine protein kinase
MKPSEDKLIGFQLGDYKISDVIAVGGMARIYLGTDARLGRTAVIKVVELDTDKGIDSNTAIRFEREARALAILEHENIIPIYQYGQESKYRFIAMKYIAGPDLAVELARIRRNNQKMEVKRALVILEQIAHALDYAHNHGILHRDVKPSNILLDTHDKAVLTDFGLALLETDSTMGTAFGTPRYISPEQAISSDHAVPQSDIYSLGVCFYEILTGQALFQGDSPMEIALAHISEPPPLPRSIDPSIPEKAELVLLKVLEKDPKKRYETAGEFIAAIKSAYETLANSAYLHHVFLSYSRRDTEIMRRLRESLQKVGLTIWVDEEGLEPGTRSWKREIQNAIDRAGCIVVILSPDAKESQWVEAELDYADGQNKSVFSVLARGNKSTSVPFGYTLAQWVDIQIDYANEVEKLISSIRKHLGIAGS